MPVKLLAKELQTSEQNILKWASEFNLNASRIEGDLVPREIVNYIKTRHLQETHPEVFKILDNMVPAREVNEIYERWIAVVRRKIREGN